MSPAAIPVNAEVKNFVNIYFFTSLIISFHSFEVFFGGVPNNKKRVIIITKRNFEIKFALLLRIAVAQLVIGNSAIVFLIVSLSI